MHGVYDDSVEKLRRQVESDLEGGWSEVNYHGAEEGMAQQKAMLDEYQEAVAIREWELIRVVMEVGKYSGDDVFPDQGGNSPRDLRRWFEKKAEELEVIP